MPMCFLLPSFLKGINLYARCHSNSPGDQSPLFMHEAETVWEATRVGAQYAQVASPQSCPGLISVGGDIVALALAILSFGTWADTAWCG